MLIEYPEPFWEGFARRLEKSHLLVTVSCIAAALQADSFGQGVAAVLLVGFVVDRLIFLGHCLLFAIERLRA